MVFQPVLARRHAGMLRKQLVEMGAVGKIQLRRDLLHRPVGIGQQLAEIAEKQGISRQAVNQMKNSAIKKLRSR